MKYVNKYYALIDFIKSLSNIGGLHTYEDFSSVKVQYVEPVIGNFGDINLIEMPPNGQGITAILIKKILDQLNGNGQLFIYVHYPQHTIRSFGEEVAFLLLTC